MVGLKNKKHKKIMKLQTNRKKKYWNRKEYVTFFELIVVRMSHINI